MLDNSTAVEFTLPQPDMAVLRQGRRSPPPFPLDVFGPFWSEWMAAAAEGAGCAVDYVAGPLLSAASAMLGNARWVSPWEGWSEPPVLWIGLVGDPSSGKSPGADPALSICRKVQDEMALSFPDKLRDYELLRAMAKATREEWEGRVKAAVKEATGHPPAMPEAAETPEEPKPPRLLVVDATTQSLVERMAANPRGLLFWRDELSGWLGGFDAFGGSGGDRAFWLEAYGGRPYVKDRVKLGTQSLVIPRLTIATLGGIQPDRLASLLLTGDDDGLPARFMWFWPESRGPKRPTRTADMSRGVAAFFRFLQLEMIPDDGGTMRPAVLSLTEEAATLFQEWREQHHTEHGDATGLLGSAYGKLPGQLLRLSLVIEHLQWAANPSAEQPRVISAEAFVAAAEFVDTYAAPMLARVYGDAALPEADRNAARIARYIVKERPSAINLRKLRREGKVPGLRDAAKMREAMKVLEEAAWCFRVGERPSGTQGRAREDYAVNPQLWAARA